MHEQSGRNVKMQYERRSTNSSTTDFKKGCTKSKRCLRKLCRRFFLICDDLIPLSSQGYLGQTAPAKMHEVTVLNVPRHWPHVPRGILSLLLSVPVIPCEPAEQLVALKLTLTQT